MLLVLAAALAASSAQPADAQTEAPSAVHPHPMPPHGPGAPGMPGQMKLPTASERAAMWNKQFDAADANHDGKISREEFAAAAERAYAERAAIMRRIMSMNAARQGQRPQSPQDH